MKGDSRILMSLPSPLGKPFFFWNTRHHSDGLAFCNMGVARFPRKWQGRAYMGSGSKGGPSVPLLRTFCIMHQQSDRITSGFQNPLSPTDSILKCILQYESDHFVFPQAEASL
jgi:hypothetical protein